MDSSDRKAALLAYKEQKVASGIYAVKSLSSGDCWIGRAPNLSTVQNRIWFTLNQGSSPHRSLQLAWNEHGADDFSFEVLETLDDEYTPVMRDHELKTRQKLWLSKLNAHTM